MALEDSILLNKFVDLSEKQAGAMASLVEIQRETIQRREEDARRDSERDRLLERIANTLERTEAAAEEGRKTAVEEVKQHITTMIRLGDRWQKIWLGVLASSASVIAAALAVLAIRSGGH